MPPAPAQHAMPRPGIRVLSVGNMYPPHHLGGAELIWQSCVRYLRGAGLAVRVLTTDFALPEPDPTIEEEPDVHRELRWYWREHSFPGYGPLRRLGIERHNRRTLARHLTDFEPAAITWWSMGGLSLALLDQGRAAGVPGVGIVLDDWLVYGPEVDGWQRLCRRGGPLGASLARLVGIPARIELGPAASWIFMSETVRRHAADAGVDVAGSRVAYRGIDQREFQPRDESTEWGGRLLCLGRIDPRKGVETAIRALPLLPEERLEVVGDGDRGHLERLHEIARDVGVARRVSFRRVPRDRIPALLANADALIFPVLWEEPWGLVPLEAMAAGTPVVSTGTGGSGEYLLDGENCLLFAPRDDPRALAHAVARIRADPSLRGRLRAGGLATAERFDERSFNAAVLEEIEAVAQ
jgi:glycogen(starch) synthase